jgi:hypothetical protein
MLTVLVQSFAAADERVGRHIAGVVQGSGVCWGFLTNARVRGVTRHYPRATSNSPDLRTPSFRKEAHRQFAAVAASSHAPTIKRSSMRLAMNEAR